MSEERPYVLGYEPRELDRLDLQGAFYADFTRRALEEAGVGAGMRVLDMGCGSGDVTALAASLVGPDGHVTGVDRHASSVESARARAQARGVANVSFEVAELDGPLPVSDVDALVGRFVLMHQAEPATMLANVARAVRPGGVVVVVESWMAALPGMPPSSPPCPTFDRAVRWMCDAVGAGGADLEAGAHLHRDFVAAGLPAPTLRLESRLETATSELLHRYTAESVRSMGPMAERCGIPPFDPDELETLEERVRAEAEAEGSVLVGWPVVAAWCRLPGAR